MQLNGPDHDHLKLYLQEVRKFDLLTPTEEFNLGMTHMVGRAAKAGLESTIDPHPMAVQVCQRLMRQGDEARVRLIEGNLRFPINIAKRYEEYDVPLIERIQNGNKGLVRSAATFDPTKGRFTTHAYFWVRQAITSALPHQLDAVALPAEIFYLNSAVRRVKTRLLIEDGHEPTDNELTQYFDITKKDLDDVSGIQHTQTLAPNLEFDDDNPWENVPDENSSLEFDRYESRSDDQDRTMQLLATLSEKQRQALTLRWLDPRQLSNPDIGREIDITPSYVGNFINKAMKSLRATAGNSNGDSRV